MKFVVKDQEGIALPQSFETRAEAEHAIEREAAKFAAGFTISLVLRTEENRLQEVRN